ncbi:hypothetical protein KDW_41700 [Dictyobacter vulcani]|uniref:Uncharacterized protein n=1 Tax=Dictyobacter vulcani TaxID=2607529 RepID=A0A5J4KJU2_9CHLR|nr:hypothetical protein KDW_41700 [Dictyobacter vulcani]
MRDMALRQVSTDPTISSMSRPSKLVSSSCQSIEHPFFVQALCSQLIDNLNGDKKEQVTTDTISRAVAVRDGYFSARSLYEV